MPWLRAGATVFPTMGALPGACCREVSRPTQLSTVSTIPATDYSSSPSPGRGDSKQHTTPGSGPSFVPFNPGGSSSSTSSPKAHEERSSPEQTGQRAAPGPLAKKRVARQASRKVIRELSTSFGDTLEADSKASIFFSHDNFSAPEQTIVVIDWDDTLFPTTWLTEDLDVAVGEPIPEDAKIRGQFAECIKRAADFLRCVCEHSRYVSIVTLAKSPWVENCIDSFAPELGRTVKELGIRVCYARDSANSETEYDKHDFQSNEERAMYWTSVKAKAIGMECKRCYSQYPGQTWKNVISFGDSDFERQGTKDVVKQWCADNARTAYQLPRTKTVKFLDDPTCDEVADQLKMLSSWIARLVAQDRGFSIDFDEADGDGLEGLEQLLHGLGDPTYEDAPANALVEGRVWKLKAGGDPMNPESWLLRRMWLSSKGQIWYESLQEARAVQFVLGVSTQALSLTCASCDEVSINEDGRRRDAYPVCVSIPSSDLPRTRSDSIGDADRFQTRLVLSADMRTTYLAFGSSEQRDQWIEQLESFVAKQA